jgi:hypothetical protein
MPHQDIFLTLYDAKGCLILEILGDSAKTRLDLQGLAKGMYLLEIRVGDKMAREKVLLR